MRRLYRTTRAFQHITTNAGVIINVGTPVGVSGNIGQLLKVKNGLAHNSRLLFLLLLLLFLFLFLVQIRLRFLLLFQLIRCSGIGIRLRIRLLLRIIPLVV